MSGTFVGREQALSSLARCRDRLVTVVGPGGVGKTRLVREASGDWRFCDCSAAKNAEEMISAVLAAFGAGGGAELNALFERALGLVVVLDNLEQVLEPARELIATWLRETQAVRFVATSREALGLAGETIVRLGPLSEDEAVQLFALRAKERSTATSLGDLATQRALARRLDGLPLAIELAAARMNVLSPQQLLERLDGVFAALPPDALRPRRHQTMEAVLEWSWQLLSVDEQRVLAACTVFENGFALEAAEHVAGAGVAVALESLHDKSLLTIAHSDATPRFALLETVRQFAWRRETEREAVERRHTDYFAGVCRMALDAFGQPRLAQLEAWLHAEFDNLVACHKRAPKEALFVFALNAVLVHRGPYAWQRALLDGVLASKRLGAEVALTAYLARAECLRLNADYPAAFADITQALALARGKKLTAWRGRLLTLSSRMRRDLGQFAEAREQALAAREAAEACGDEVGLAMALADLGWLERSTDHFYRALALFARTTAVRQQTAALVALGTLFYEERHYSEALTHIREAVRLQSDARDRRLNGIARTHLAIALLLAGAWDDARAELTLALELQRETLNRRYETITLCYLGLMASAERKHQEAERLLSEALLLAETLASPWHVSFALAHLARVKPHTASPEVARALVARALTVGGKLAGPDYPRFLTLSGAFADMVEGQAAPALDVDARGSAELQLLVRALATASPSSARETAASTLRLELARDHTWFRVADGARRSLATRKTLQRFVGRLALQHTLHHGAAVGKGVMLSAVWPSTALTPSAARDRLYNAVATLRRLGLGEVLLTRSDGYLFDPRVDLVEL